MFVDILYKEITTWKYGEKTTNEHNKYLGSVNTTAGIALKETVAIVVPSIKVS